MKDKNNITSEKFNNLDIKLNLYPISKLNKESREIIILNSNNPPSPRARGLDKNKYWDNIKNKKTHEYHLVENSPWPIYITISILSIVLSIVLIFNNTYIFNSYIYKLFICISLLGLFICLFYWFKEIHIEGTLEGYHTERVQKGLTIGFILFIISEICIFTTLFFSFFYNSLIPSIEISSIYPPIGIESINPKTLPLLNTIILFISGITSTCSLNLLISNSTSIKFNIFKPINFIIGNIEGKSIIYLTITIILGLLFSYFQYFEYFYASFTLSDSVFGSNFYTLTGFHGIHVIIGIILLIIALIRLILNHYNTENYLNLIFANIYWHFVDYVWIILFLFLYCWAN